MTNFDTNKLPIEEKHLVRRTTTHGREDGGLLRESTSGSVGRNADRAARGAGSVGDEPDVDCFWCIVLCMLDIPSSDLKSMWGEVLKANIAAQHYAGLPKEEAKEKGLVEYAEDAKSIAKITKKLATFIVEGQIEITITKVIGNPTKPAINEKITISSHHFAPLEKLRWKIISILTKKVSETVVVSLFKKFAIGYNILEWVLTVRKGTECVGLCVAAKVVQATHRLAADIAEVQRNVDKLLVGFFNWLAEEFNQAFARTIKQLNPENWTYAAALPASAKQKISDIHYHFQLLSLMPPSYDSIREFSKKLPVLGVSTATINKVSEGIMEAFYFEAGSSPTVVQKQKDIQEISQQIRDMNPAQFVYYLEDHGFVTLPATLSTL